METESNAEEAMAATPPSEGEVTHELTDTDLQRIWWLVDAICIRHEDEDNHDDYNDAVDILSVLYDRLGLYRTATLDARAKRSLLNGDLHDAAHDKRIEKEFASIPDDRTDTYTLTNKDLHDFASDLTEELAGDWATYPAEDEGGRPEAQIGYTQERKTSPDDHVRVIVRESEDATFIVTGFDGTLADGEFNREHSIAHIECEDVPEVDLTAHEAVQDYVQMLADHVEDGVYFDDR